MKQTILVLMLLAAQSSFAEDSTHVHKRKPLFLSITAGYTSTRAGGSLVSMVQEFNQQFNIHNAYQKNGGGIALSVLLQKQFSGIVYYKTGLSYIQKHVYPEGNSYPLYKDSLNTGYLSVPLLFGAMQPLNRAKTIWVSIEAGPVGGFKIVDKTYKAPDRAGYKTMPVVLSGCGGAGLTFGSQYATRLQLHYSYTADFTNAIDETLYWGGTNEPYRTRSYKYKTQSFSIGLLLPLSKMAP
jgi:hypothetical protein